MVSVTAQPGHQYHVSGRIHNHRPAGALIQRDMPVNKEPMHRLGPEPHLYPVSGRRIPDDKRIIRTAYRHCIHTGHPFCDPEIRTGNGRNLFRSFQHKGIGRCRLSQAEPAVFLNQLFSASRNQKIVSRDSPWHNAQILDKCNIYLWDKDLIFFFLRNDLIFYSILYLNFDH